MNILFAGTPESSSRILESLLKIEEVNIKGVITQPDKRGKRGAKLYQSYVSKVAKSSNIKIFKPHNLNSAGFKQDIIELNIDLLIVVAYGRILPTWLLNQPKLIPLNIHFSILPKYRGASPIQSALINGDSETGVTFMRMTDDLDAGEIIDIFKCKISENDDKISLESKLTKISIRFLNSVLQNIKSSKIQIVNQDDSKASYCNKIIKSDGLLDFNQNSQSIFNSFRAYKEWPKSSFLHKEKLIKIHSMFVSDKKSDGSPGTISNFDRNGISVNTKDKIIVITNLQFPNKKIISSSDAFNSYKNFFS